MLTRASTVGLSLLTGLLLSVSLAGCGNRGPLVRPEAVIEKLESKVKTIDPASESPSANKRPAPPVVISP